MSMAPLEAAQKYSRYMELKTVAWILSIIFYLLLM